MAVPDPGDASYPPHVPARKRATVTPAPAAAEKSNRPGRSPRSRRRAGRWSERRAGVSGGVRLRTRHRRPARGRGRGGRPPPRHGRRDGLPARPRHRFLRFAFDAGIQNERSRRWLRRIKLPIGTGMLGRAVADRAVVNTDDYANDAAFPHSPAADHRRDDHRADPAVLDAPWSASGDAERPRR